MQGLQRDVSTLQQVVGLSNHSRQRKKWSSYTRQHQRVIKKQAKAQIQQALSLCTTTAAPLKITSVQLTDEETGEIEVLDLDKGTFTCKLAKPQPISTTNSFDNKSLFALYTKDKHNISD